MSPPIVQKIVTMEVIKVIVETWHPSPPVRSSNLSDPNAQIALNRRGVRRGNARDKGSKGRGRQVPDCGGDVNGECMDSLT